VNLKQQILGPGSPAARVAAPGMFFMMFMMSGCFLFSHVEAVSFVVVHESALLLPEYSNGKMFMSASWTAAVVSNTRVKMSWPRKAQLLAVSVLVGCTLILLPGAVDSRPGPMPAPLATPTCWQPQKRAYPPLTLVTITAGLDPRYSACLRANRIAYARLHGYEYCDFSASVAAHRAFGFQKLVALHHVFLERKPGSLAWYLDADALVMNRSIAIDALLVDHTDIVWASEPDEQAAGSPFGNPLNSELKESRKDFELRNLLAKLGIDDALAQKAGEPWTIQGGSFVMRNTAWSVAILETIYREAGSTLVLRAPWDWARLSDRAQWMRWAYHHPHEARKHMTLLPGRAFNSMGADYAAGDFVLHAGGGGAFGLNVFGNDKYVELLRRCEALEEASTKVHGTNLGRATHI
jgi:hypothetical protein